MKAYQLTVVDTLFALGLINATGQDVMANQFIKDGGLVNEFLIADGSKATIAAGTNVTLGWVGTVLTINSSSGTTSPLTTKGDLYGFSTVNARLPVGVDGEVLIADSLSALGIKWGAAGGTGTVTSIATSGAILGGTITTTGTISHSTASGYKHIPSGGLASQILQYSADGTAIWYTPPWTSNTGVVEAVDAGTGIAVAGTLTVPLVSLDLPGLALGGTLVGSDYLIAVNGVAQNRQLISSIPLSIFNNDLGLGSGTVTSVTGGNGIVSTGGTTPVLSLTTLSADWDAGSTYSITAAEFIGSSDKNLKENIIEYTNNYIFSDYKQFNFIGDNQVRVGVIAQELEINHPEFVRTNEKGVKAVSYIDLHSAEIAVLKREVEFLKSKLI